MKTSGGTMGARSSAEALLDEWIAWLRGAGFRRASTAQAYRRAVRAFLRASSTTDFAAVTPRTLDAYVTRLQLDGLSTSTIRLRLFPLRGFWKWAVSREYLTKNPAAPELLRVPPDDSADRPVVVLDQKKRARLYAAAGAQQAEKGKREPQGFFDLRARKHAAQGARDEALLRVWYAAALRVSEVAGLRWDHVFSVGGGELAIVLAASKRSDRPSKPIYLGPGASRALREWKVARAAGGKRGPLVFGLSGRACAVVFDRCVRLAGLSRPGHRLTGHSLRASRATDAYVAGMTELGVADLLRHHGLGAVQKYVRAANESRRRFEALATLPEHVGKGLVQPRLQPRRHRTKRSGSAGIGPRP